MQNTSVWRLFPAVSYARCGAVTLSAALSGRWWHGIQLLRCLMRAVLPGPTQVDGLGEEPGGRCGQWWPWGARWAASECSCARKEEGQLLSCDWSRIRGSLLLFPGDVRLELFVEKENKDAIKTKGRDRVRSTHIRVQFYCRKDSPGRVPVLWIGIYGHWEVRNLWRRNSQRCTALHKCRLHVQNALFPLSWFQGFFLTFPLGFLFVFSETRK